MALEQKYLNVPTIQEGYIEVIMYVPDPSVKINTVTSEDILEYSNIDAIKDIKQYSSTTIATLEKNLWLLNGRFMNVVDGTTIPGYISNTMSDDNGDFETNPTVTVNLTNKSYIEYFSIMLNPAVPSAYPKTILVHAYNGDTLVNTFEKKVVTTVVENDVTTTTYLDTLPSVMFEMNSENIDKLLIEFVGTAYGHRRIRLSTVLFGKVIYLDQDKITSCEFTDKTSYACDTLPSRVFKFDVNNYEHIYDVDNPDNGYVALDNQTIVQFRVGYNVFRIFKR